MIPNYVCMRDLKLISYKMNQQDKLNARIRNPKETNTNFTTNQSTPKPDITNIR